jgi:hypothetical protein
MSAQENVMNATPWTHEHNPRFAWGGRPLERPILTKTWVRIEGFHAYRDAYGKDKAQELWRSVAQVLTDSLAKTGSHGDFVGCEGDRDFFIVSSRAAADAATSLAKEVFEWLAPNFYTLEDAKQGGVRVQDDSGGPRLHRIVRLAVRAERPHGGAPAESSPMPSSVGSK